MLLPFLPFQVMYFRTLPHSLGYIFSIKYSFLWWYWILYMHHVHDCSRVLEVRRGLVVSTVLFPPTSLKYRVIKTLGLCSCGKGKKKVIRAQGCSSSYNLWKCYVIGTFYTEVAPTYSTTPYEPFCPRTKKGTKCSKWLLLIKHFRFNNL